MKNLILILVSFLVIFASCNDKKEEIKTEKQAALKKIKGLVVNESYFEKYVFENKNNSKSLEFVEILNNQTIQFIDGKTKISARLKKPIIGLKEGNKIYLNEGWVESSGIKYKLFPAKIEKFPEFWKKEDLLPWITKYPLTPIILLEDGSYYPVYYSLEYFLEVVQPEDKIKIIDGPEIFVKFKDEFYLFNANYKLWKKRPKLE
jgi:hypothetical protein